MTNHSPDSIQQNVLAKVRTGEVRRRPRWHFAARIIATACLSVLLLIISATVVSFILFSLHESGEQFLLGFGLEGIRVFLTLFPWIPAAIAVLVIVLLDWLVRGFEFGYRIPLMNIFLATVALSIVGGVVLNFTPLHPVLVERAHNHELPFFDDAYSHIFDSHETQGVYRGTVISVATSSFALQHNDWDQDPDDGRFTIFITASSTLALPHVGEKVLVFGNPEHDFIEAKNIQVLSPASR